MEYQLTAIGTKKIITCETHTINYSVLYAYAILKMVKP